MPGARRRAIVATHAACHEQHARARRASPPAPTGPGRRRACWCRSTAARTRSSRRGRRRSAVNQPDCITRPPAEPDPEAQRARVAGPLSRARADLQRHEIHRHRERHRRHEQVDHRRAVHREQLVVGVVREQLRVRLGQLSAHQQREHAADAGRRTASSTPRFRPMRLWSVLVAAPSQPGMRGTAVGRSGGRRSRGPAPPATPRPRGEAVAADRIDA